MSLLIPLKVRVPSSFQGSTITAIRIQDVARDVWYSWDKNSSYPNGYWDNNGGGGNNAPVGETPMITAGPGNLYIAFYAVSNYSYSVNLYLNVYDVNYNALATSYTLVGAHQGAGVEYTGDMPATSYTLILWSSP